MHREEHKDAVILIAGENFGSGSSREHAVWAIKDHGFGAVIAPSFADIFRNNSTKNGLLAIDLPEETVENLLRAVREDPETVITIELDELTVTAPNVHETFEMDDFTRRRIMEGLDDISLTLTHEDELDEFETISPGSSTERAVELTRTKAPLAQESLHSVKGFPGSSAALR